MAYQDELAAANRLPTREARLAARNAVRAKYGMETEKRKRGGFAGAYDRNKGLIQAALPTLAGFLVPGSSMLAGALTGGLARGLDRPGQRGVGFDFNEAARGAGTGAALGGLGGGFRGAPAAPAAPKAPAMPAGPAPGQVMATGGYGQPMGTPGAGTGSLVGGATGGGSTLRNLLTNPQVIAGAAGGVADVIGQRSQQQIAEQQLAQQGEQFQQRFDVEEEERKRQQAQANRLAGFFMPRAQG